MNSQLSTFMALSGLAAANIYLTDPRPAWIWAEDGKSILWTNPAGAAFFGVDSLSGLADLTGLARAPARPHIARVATSGPIDRDTTDRLRFYRGLRVMLLTCACRRLVLSDGSNGALIVALDAPGTADEQDESALLALTAHPLHAAFLYRRDGSVQAGDEGSAGPDLATVKTALRCAKHAPLRQSFDIDGAARDTSALMLDTGSILLLADMTDASVSDAPGTDAPAAGAVDIAMPRQEPDGVEPEASEPAIWPAETLASTPLSQEEARHDEAHHDQAGQDGAEQIGTVPPSPVEVDTDTDTSTTTPEPAPARRRWAQGGLFAFASGTRFLSSSRGSDAAAADEVEAADRPDELLPPLELADEDAHTALTDQPETEAETEETDHNADGLDASLEADASGASDIVEDGDPHEETVDAPAHTGLFFSLARDEAANGAAEDAGAADDTLASNDLIADDIAAASPFTDGPADADATDDTARDVSRDAAQEGDEVSDADSTGTLQADDVFPAESSAAAAASGFRFDARERPVRFAWKMDIDRRFTFLSPEFAETLGPEAADVVGLTWEEVAERFDLDRDGRVSAALRRRDTWSGRTVEWPVSGAALRVPVDMAALPAFDRQRVFEGFRGFGVCRTGEALDDADALGTHIVMRPTLAATGAGPVGTEEVSHPEEPAAGELMPDMPVLSGDEADTDDMAAELAIETAPDTDAPAIAGEVVEPAPERFEPDEPAASGLPSDDAGEELASQPVGTPETSASEGGMSVAEDGFPEPEDDDADIASSGFVENALPESPDETPDEAPDEASDEVSDEILDASEENEPATGTLMPVNGDTDTALQADMLDNPAFGTRTDDEDTRAVPVPDEEPTPPVPAGVSFRDEATDTSRLSKPEREAFRKIAEALGARSESDEPAALTVSPDKADTTDTGPADTTKPAKETLAHEAAEPAAPGNVASLGIVPRAPAPATPRAARTSLLDKLPVGVAIIDGEDVDYANATLLDLLGYPDLEALHAVGGLDAIFAEPEDWPSSLPGAMTERTMRIRLADGGAKPVKSRLHSVAWKDGTALMMSLLDRHDPAQEAALDRLHETQSSLSLAEEHLAEMDAVLETATDGVLILDEGGRIMKVNRSAEALFDGAREDMVGAPLSDYLAPESHRDASDYLDGLARNGVASVLNDGREVIGQLRSGGLIPLFMTIGRVGHGAEGPRFCTVLRDITQWKTAEEELTDAKRQAENASSQKSDFLAKISHEIRTPLNAIIGFSEVMMEERFGPVGNDRYKGYLRDIHNSGSHIMSLINDLLDLSKIEAGKLDLTFEAVSANDIIRECVALMQPQANRERVIIRASLPTSVPKIVADGRSVRQIVLNLLSNAIKFNQPGGQVIVSTALEDSGEVILRVRDTGMGMSHQDLAAAMEPFRQLHTARHGGGTGLGLPLTKALVEANRASFRIDSEVNHGTLIEVTFPPQRVLAE